MEILISLRKVKFAPTYKRAKKAAYLVRKAAEKRAGTQVSIGNRLNETLWASGSKNPPSKITLLLKEVAGKWWIDLPDSPLFEQLEKAQKEKKEEKKQKKETEKTAQEKSKQEKTDKKASEKEPDSEVKKAANKVESQKEEKEKATEKKSDREKIVKKEKKGEK